MLVLAALAICLSFGARAMPEGWLRALGDAAIEKAFRLQAPVLLKASMTRDRLAELSVAGSAFANAYVISGEPQYSNRAREIADFLVANVNVLGDRAAGWGPNVRHGYGFCPDVDNFRGEDLWETTRALNAILKASEIAPSRNLVEIAMSVVDRWPSEDIRPVNDGPYAAGGMRFYRKQPDACARKYVKNTNIAIGEVLYRLARQTGEERYYERARQVLNAELWEIVTRRNFGYHGAMIHAEPGDPQNQRVLAAERRKVRIEADGRIVCRDDPPDASCWNHLAFEAYALYQVQLLSGRDLSDPIGRIMGIYRTSSLGDTRRFPWRSGNTATHITAYNCYLRNSENPIYRDECLRALQHDPRSSMIFYSLIPDNLVRRGKG
jgi:hypothetical protein